MKNWGLFLSVKLSLLLNGLVFAQVNRGNFTSANPFEEFLCPIIGIIRNYGTVATIVFVVLIALGTYFMDKGGEDRSIMSALKGLGMLVVGIGIVLILYFIFEDWVISQFGVSVCAAAIR